MIYTFKTCNGVLFQLLWIASPICLFYIGVLLVYRLYLSPLAKFPGSKLAAASGWYETYFQLLKEGGGRYTFQIQKWHEKYGRIIRINPHEIHIDDPEFYNNIYPANSQGVVVDKPISIKHQFNAPGATFSTVEHELHKQRKTALNPFFSKRKILDQSANIQNKVDKLLHRLGNEYDGNSKPLNLGDLFSCFTADIVTTYSFDRCYDFLDAPDFLSPFTKSIEGFKAFSHWAIQFPFISRMMGCIPGPVLIAIQPGLAAAYDYKNAMKAQIKDIQNSMSRGKDDRTHGTIFTELMNSDLPPSEFALDRLMDEASGVVGAGIETTKWASVVTCFHIINNPSVRDELFRDLVREIPDPTEPPSLTNLEKIPLLMACIEEGLRLSYGGVARSPRILRNKPLQYQNYIIPPGVPVSSSTWCIHHNEDVFPDSFAFKPERWLNNPKGPDGTKHLSQYLCSFGKGTRGCLGIQLGYAEMILAISALFRNFHFELFETDRKDVDCYFDQIAPGVHPDSKGVRVLLSRVEV